MRRKKRTHTSDDDKCTTNESFKQTLARHSTPSLLSSSMPSSIKRASILIPMFLFLIATSLLQLKQTTLTTNAQNVQFQDSRNLQSLPVSVLNSKQQSISNGQQQQSVLQVSSREIEKQIVDRILGEGYDKRIRPAGFTNASQASAKSANAQEGPTIVKVNTLVRSISKIDDVTMEYSVQLSLRQEWTDDRLAFAKMPQYKSFGLNSITLTEQERLWKPDLFFRNEKEGHFHKIIMPNVLLRINGDGAVLYSIRISLVLACPMDLKYYPLDKQNCTIEMASYGYLDSDLKFLWKETSPVQIAKPLNLPRFALETHETAYCASRTNTGAYSCLRIDLIFKREFSYYLIQIYIPCCMLVIVSWVSFWLDPNAIPARVSLGVTTLLTMATQISGINASLPPVSYIKAIDVWTGVCLTFVFSALLEFALVNYASRSDQHKREMLSTALTHTQQLRWREATAVAAANGVAPPTSPPFDENSPSAIFAANSLSDKPPQVFFAPHFQFPLSATSTATATAATNQQQHSQQHARLRKSAAAANNRPSNANINNNNSNNKLAANNRPLPNKRDLHMGVGKKKTKNFCQAWLAKFPTRSKRIDVISRIFFPLMFALFNLVYWTTYLFREEDIVA